MGTMLDYIASSIFFGILVMTVLRVQINISQAMYENTGTVITQGNAVSLARQMERDFMKMGYRIPGRKIWVADTNKITFVECEYGTTIRDSIMYSIGDTSKSKQTSNPRDFPMYYQIGNKLITQQWGLTTFKLSYFDTLDNVLTTPVTGSNLDKIKGILVSFKVESPEPVYTPFSKDTVWWSSVTWQKLMWPRNLINYYY